MLFVCTEGEPTRQWAILSIIPVPSVKPPLIKVPRDDRPTAKEPPVESAKSRPCARGSRKDDKNPDGLGWVSGRRVDGVDRDALNDSAADKVLVRDQK